MGLRRHAQPCHVLPHIPWPQVSDVLCEQTEGSVLYLGGSLRVRSSHIALLLWPTAPDANTST